MEKGADVSQLESVLYLIAHGFTQREASIIIGRTRRTIARWIDDIRQGRRTIPDWLADPSTVRRKIKHRENKHQKRKAA